MENCNCKTFDNSCLCDNTYPDSCQQVQNIVDILPTPIENTLFLVGVDKCENTALVDIKDIKHKYPQSLQAYYLSPLVIRINATGEPNTNSYRYKVFRKLLNMNSITPILLSFDQNGEFSLNFSIDLNNVQDVYITKDDIYYCPIINLP